MMKSVLYNIFLIVIVLITPMQTIAQEPSVYVVNRMEFNTDAFSEISPVIVEDGIIFCSDRRFSTFKDRTSFDGDRLYNMYMAERIDSSRWTKSKVLKSERSSLFNNGPLCIAADGRTVYFTSEIETGKAAKRRSFRNHSGIFIAELSGTDIISVRPFEYNNPQYDVGHPSVSSDGQYLFFSSDMPGGHGGSDLYYCELVNGEWSSPVNMGARVNSSGPDNYPYIHPSGKLYFSSGRPGGAGKMDVYHTTKYNGEWDDPVLMPEPVNSSSDDFAFVAVSDLQTGFFASNRNRSDDVYEFRSTIIRKASCPELEENSYCFRFSEENAAKSDTMPFRYEWKFGDGNRAVGSVVEHCYEGPGVYIVQLDVVNLITSEVMYNEKSDTLVLEDIVQPYITSPDTVVAGQSVMLDAEDTNLPGWKIAEYYWNLGDESIAIGKVIDKKFTRPGIYNVQLMVSSEQEPGGMIREACVSKNIIVISQP
jgi:hypothetical protein